jgi:hypothetical protein
MRILLEAATESAWVAQHLETLGHDVIVADPTFAPHVQRAQSMRQAEVGPGYDACSSACANRAPRVRKGQRASKRGQGRAKVVELGM